MAATAVGAPLVAGCASTVLDGKLRPTGQDRYQFEIAAGALAPADSDRAEATRLAVLRRIVDHRGVCPTGYVIHQNPHFPPNYFVVGA